MGIKGIYPELGRGHRVALARLTADSFREKGRPLRLAIDFAIWQFQAQAARGGTNPAVRTLFYRLVRLLGTPVQPIFVFDGPNKPAFKRNKRSGRGDGVAIAQAKRLIRLFGFPVHDAPGEAEAECALMQRRGLVDAVLSEDVDTIMFGCTRTLRNWSAEGKGSKAPTHITLYDVHDMGLANLGLDREGMVLVALMSGGDYLPDGIPRCGVKVACEAAKAGYGKSICRLKVSDGEGLREWRRSLVHELRTNESGYFRTKHMALSIPEDFPNLEVLRYYTHPVVSPESAMESLRQKLEGGPDELHLDALREFARETFDWDYRIGAVKFIRVLGAALLVRKMLLGAADKDGTTIQRISGRRTHFSTDGEPELRLSFMPRELVPIDLSQEVDEEILVSRDGLALNSDEEVEDGGSLPPASQAAKVFDETKPDLAWVLEDVVRNTTPRAFSAWEGAERAKAVRKSPTKKTAAKGKASEKTKKTTAATGMQRGAIDKFVRVTKTSVLENAAMLEKGGSSATPAAKKSQPPGSRPSRAPSSSRQPQKEKEKPFVTSPSLSPSSTPPREPSKPTSEPSEDPDQHPADPWTSPGSLLTPTRTPFISERPHQQPQETIVISSSPAATEASPPPSPPPPFPISATTAAARDPRPPPASRKEVPSPVRSRPAPSQVGKGVKAAAVTGSPESAGYKQTSMDMFVEKKKKKKKKNQAGTNDGSSSSQGQKDQLEDPFGPGDDDKRDVDGAATAEAGDQKKKRLLVPRTSAVGFFKEIEVDEDVADETASREERRLKASGQARGVIRYSDVSIIDLTQ
ncbi:holliday junction resolvase YEN1 [Geosmithia morbida]|uniref:Holliday junction resolvase YEN1 n=1 Tax=Geosmithia morbida TaxID=1094350 RepID=A0A9P5D2P0_9HYPO|nr:holliday junction resolvase YEN1 [Geosmithia morbida]KAF4121666.1 holliday junction resolvase YEN1 [Geosmithia morbida]